VREGAGPAIARQHVPGLRPGVEPGRVGHVVGGERAGDDIPEHPGADVEERQQVRDREAAAGPPALGPAEVLPELGRVGHREGRAVGHEDAMAEPPAGVLGGRVERVGDPSEQVPEDLQGLAGACLAVGGIGEATPRQAGEMIDRGVAVGDLDEEDVDRGDGVEERGPPGMPGPSADLGDGGPVEEAGGISLEATKDANDAAVDGKPPSRGIVMNRHREGGIRPPQVDSGMRLATFGLMPFVPRT